MILGFDTETTGLPIWSTPSDDPGQPHVIQLAAILYSLAGEEVDRISTIIQPGAGARMEPEAFAAHGISLERARAEGMPPIETIDRFFGLVDQATLLVGHNGSFDVRIMRIAAARHKGFKWEPTIPLFCTMKRSSSIVNLPPTPAMVRSGRNWPKPPKLSECIQHFFGEELDGAHDALVDVRATMRVFFHLTGKLGVPIPTEKPAPRAPRDYGAPAAAKAPAPTPAPAQRFTENPFAAAAE